MVSEPRTEESDSKATMGAPITAPEYTRTL